MNIVRDYLKNNTGLVQHQISSFNNLLFNGLQQVISRDPLVECPDGTEIIFGEVCVTKPMKTLEEDFEPFYPQDARNFMVSYEGQILVDIDIKNSKGQTSHFTKVCIGKLPIMVGSGACNLVNVNKVEKKECEMDPGGYFIVNGKERVLVSQLRPIYDKVLVFPSVGNKGTPGSAFTAEIRTMNLTNNSLMIKAKIDLDGHLSISLPHIKDYLMPGLIFRAYHLNWSDIEKNLKLPIDVINDIRIQFEMFDSCESARQEIMKSSTEQSVKVLDFLLRREIFFNLFDQSPLNICIHIGYMLKKLVETQRGVRVFDDKDNLKNKRLDCSDGLILFLFKTLFKQLHKNIIASVSSRKGIIQDYISLIKSASTISSKITSCFLTGIWEVNKGASFARLGVSQVLSVQNYGARISHLRRIMFPIGNKGKIFKIRQLHSSHYGFICPYETPEGQQVGTVLNLSLMTQLAYEVPFMEMLMIIEMMKTFQKNQNNKCLILLNGSIIGTTNSPISFVSEFSKLRESNLVESSVSISHIFEENEIHIFCDNGRLVRPLFKVFNENNQQQRINHYHDVQMSWQFHLKKNFVVLRDACELEQMTIAMTPSALSRHKCHLMELEPASSVGIMASVIPFFNHSQSPRVAYQSCKGKQAIGIPLLSMNHRWDTSLHVLSSPQKPLIQSDFIDVVNFNTMSHGVNVIVALMCCTGFNQEDSLILNKASIDRGLFDSFTYKTIVETKKMDNADVEICFPKAEYRKKKFDYSFLNKEGIIEKPTSGGSLFIKEGTVLIGKTLNKVKKTEDNKRETQTKDISVAAKQSEEGYLDEVCDFLNSDGIRVIRVRIRSYRRPQVGDKFASSCAQKSTCGIILDQHDLPFDKNGIQPDVIMNPHAIPSRMTINNLLEIFYNKVFVITGKKVNATAFRNENLPIDIRELFRMFDSEDIASTTMYCGSTGKKLTTKVFMGPGFFQRLKHLVSDKIHARCTGPLDTFTRQPVAGRTHDGGLRIGEMERDSLIVHGNARFLNEALFLSSDKFSIFVCASCGTSPHNLKHCHNCENSEVLEKNIPYAAKLLFQLLMGMGIKIRFD